MNIQTLKPQAKVSDFLTLEFTREDFHNSDFCEVCSSERAEHGQQFCIYCIENMQMAGEDIELAYDDVQELRF